MGPTATATIIEYPKKIINKELKAIPNWVLFGDYIDKTTGKIIHKVPFNAKSNHLTKAKTNNKNTWADYKTCVEASTQNNVKGIGFVFSDDDPFIGIDKDHCFDSTGNLDPEAAEIIKFFGTYTEKSPSAKGYHLILKVKDKRAIQEFIKARTKTHYKCKNNGIELYTSTHYFTYTEDVFEKYDTIVEVPNEMVMGFFDKYFKKLNKVINDNCISKNGKSPILSDVEVFETIEKASNYGEFEKYYYNGALSNNDSSSTDLTVMNYLVFYTQDYDQLIRLFLKSKHHENRSKDLNKIDPDDVDRGKPYLELTFRRALEDCQNFYQPKFYGYTVRNKEGINIPISNFKLKPKVKVNDDNEVWYDVDIVTRDKKYNRDMKGSILSDVKGLQKWIAMADTSLFYEHRSLVPVKKEFENLKEVNPVTHGFNCINGVWRFIDNVLYDDVIVKDREILKKYKLDLINGTPGNLFSYNADKISVPITLASVAFYLNARLEKLDISLPVLKVTGEPESGKTTTLNQTVNKLFNLKKTDEMSAKSTTDFAYRRNSESSTFKPLSITEIGEADERHINIITNVVKHAYDRGSVVVGNKYQTLNTYQYKSPIIISGQTSTGFEDMAIKDRAIEVCFSKMTIMDPKYKGKLKDGNFAALRQPLIEYIEKLSDEKLSNFYYTPNITSITPRSENNIRVLMIAAQILKDLGLFVPDNALDILIENYKNSHTSSMSIIGKTLTHIKRMGSDWGTDYQKGHKEYYSIRIEKVYPTYTKYLRDFNIAFKPISEEDFKQQFVESEFNFEPGTYKNKIKLEDGKTERRIRIKIDKWNELE
jgi:hypothetical protein